MGLLDRLFGKKSSAVDISTADIAESDASVKIDSAVATNGLVIDMSKSAENLNKVLIDMSKTGKIDMSKHTARVALAMDYSGSMDHLFDNGSVQRTITRLLPISLKFDDNGELESWLFSDGKKRLKAVTIDNYNNYVNKVMMKSGMYMGGTNYAPVLREMVHYYKDIEPSTIPAFIIFITDGDNWDKKETNEIIMELSNYNIFVQFVGIGNDNFGYLKSLDNMEGRTNDNTGFISVYDMDKMSDEKLYTEILRQYKDWLNNK